MKTVILALSGKRNGNKDSDQRKKPQRLWVTPEPRVSGVSDIRWLTAQLCRGFVRLVSVSCLPHHRGCVLR